MRGLRLKILFALIGAFFGAALGGASAAAALAVFGALAGWWWAGRNAGRKAADAAAATMLERIRALELEVRELQQRAGHAAAPRAPIPAAAPATGAPTTIAPVAAPVVDVPAPAPRPLEVAAPAVAAVPVAAAPVAGAPIATAPVAPPVAPVPPRAPAIAPAPVRPAPPPPPAVPLRDRLPPVVANLIFGGNTIVKIGVLILFLGLAFLLRYTAERVTVPVEFRYMGVALVGVVLTGLGWRLRDRRDASGGTGYGLILQGAGIGVFYLTALGALHLNPLLSANAAFGFMALVSVFGALLAVKQDAPWLAYVSVAEGFAAPVLVGGGNGEYVPLMSYLALLDAGILAIAWFKAWRPLNLVGAVATSTLAAGWAREHYVGSDYAGMQAYLLFFFLLFTLTGVLFARRALAAGDAPSVDRPLAERALDALHQVGRVDSTLTFGVPLAAFSLQYLLVRDMPWGPAWAAFAFALFHILLGGGLMRGARARFALLGEAHVIVGTIFATLAVPLALQGVWTGATWAIEAAGMYWLGARQRRTYARAFALAVMLGAALRLVAGLAFDTRPGVPLITGSTLGMGMLAVALCAVDAVRRRIAADQRTRVEAIAVTAVPFAAAFAFAALSWMACTPLWAGAVTAWIAFGAAALAGRLAAPSLRIASWLLHLAALTVAGIALQASSEAAEQVHAWQDLAATLLIGVALLATGWLGLRDAWREAARGTPRPIPLASSAGLVLGLGAASASLLFELAPADAALAWPAIGLAAAIVGARLRSGALMGSAFALQVAAGVASLVYEPSVWSYVPTDVSLANTLWIPLLLSLAGLALGDRLRAADTGAARAWWHSWPAQWLVVAWSVLWWSRTLPPLIWHVLQSAIPGPDTFGVWPHWQLMWVTLSALAAVALARWRDWRVLGQATLVAVPCWIVLGLQDMTGAAPSAHLGWIAWPLALLAHPLLARLQARWRPALLGAPLQLAGGWLFVALGTRECIAHVQAIAGVASGWVALAAMLVPALVLIASVQPALLRRLRVDGAASLAWRGVGCGAVAAYLFLWLWAGNTTAGDAAPLPWAPLLNPLEIGQGIALLALLVWMRALPLAWRARVPAQALPAVAGVTAFALVTGLVLRSCHHFAGIEWSADALYDSTLAQAALSVAWSLIGVALMVAGHRGGRRVVWSVGAALLGVVVAKLFLVELADRGTLSRIVSFIVVGGLMLTVGYFAPIPPRRPDPEPALPDVPGETA